MTWFVTSVPTILLAIALIWLSAVFVRRVREPRVVVKRTDADTLDLEVSNVIAGEFQRFREEGGGSRLEIVENVDREIEVPLAVAAFGPDTVPSRIRDLLRRTFVIDLVYGKRAGEIVIVARLSAPWGRLLASRVFAESDFKVLCDAAAVEGTRSPRPPGPGAPSKLGAGGGDTDAKKRNQAPPASGDTGSPQTEPDGTTGTTDAESTEATPAPTEATPAPTEAELDRRQRLAVVVGAWAAYELSRGRSANHSAWLTPDWRSYALFRLGAEWHAAGELILARRAYSEAVAADGGNRGALFDLAMLDARAGCHAAALSRLHSARRETEVAARGVRGGVALDRLWYRTMYNLGATYRHAELDGGNAPRECRVAPDRERAKTLVTDMLTQSAYTILALERRRRSPKWPEYAPLVRFLQVAQLSAKALLDDLNEPSGDAAPS